MKWIIRVLMLIFAVEAHSQEAMFNACDQCSRWPAKRTAILVKALSDQGVDLKFVTVGKQVILAPLNPYPVCYEYFALFFPDKNSCREHLSRTKIKCELTVTSIVGD